MPRLLAALFLVLAFGVAQRAEVSVGSPFGLQGGVRFPLVPLLLDGRAYGGVGLEAMGGGVDPLPNPPLTFPQEGRGQGGVRGVLGTWLNLPLPLLGVYLEAQPVYYLTPVRSFGVGLALGLSVGL